jgi:phosphopantothenoylcysteine decarboxylase/phosphopantothenate--cysteine ligase
MKEIQWMAGIVLFPTGRRGIVMEKCVVVGVTGGIAAYKAAELVRLLIKGGFSTRVVMTRNATRFVSPLTFEALSGGRVIVDMWEGHGEAIDHISLAQQSKLVVVAPATANFVGKAACGIADDFLSTMVLAAAGKVVVCPSMNSVMYMNEAVQTNLDILRSRGIEVITPGEGGLACGTEGPGRLPEPLEVYEIISDMLAGKDLNGLKIVVTAGPTVESIDPVRFISNRSSGKMGFALAAAARRRGADVVLISGPTFLDRPHGVEFIPVKTAEEMRSEVLARCDDCNVIIKAAAVSDFRPKTSIGSKIKKSGASLSMELELNPDILAELGSRKGFKPYILVGFAAETENLTRHAQEKLEKKNLDMIVANDVTAPDAGFDADTNRVKILYRDHSVEDIPLMSKQSLADLLLDRVRSLFEESTGRMVSEE